MKRINTDALWATLQQLENERHHGIVSTFPKPLGAPGLSYTRSFNDSPNLLVNPKDYKEVVNTCNDRQIFARYHQERSWAPPGFRWNQNGLPYCWAWSLVAALMDQRAREGKPTVLLAPISLGPAVGFRNEGNYLEATIKYVMERGVCSVEYAPIETWHTRNSRGFKRGWEDDALQYRPNPDDVWTMDNSSKMAMIQHCITNLRQGDPLYIAYYWWGHALELIGLVWNEAVENNLEFIVRNSHDESEPIVLTGLRAVPDEAYGILATRA